jgi:hypothetical protein
LELIQRNPPTSLPNPIPTPAIHHLNVKLAITIVPTEIHPEPTSITPREDPSITKPDPSISNPTTKTKNSKDPLQTVNHLTEIAATNHQIAKTSKTNVPT